MKKANIVIAFDEEKLAAVRMYMSQRELDLKTELEKTLDVMYVKFVPSNVREFIDMKAERTKARPPVDRQKKDEVTDEEE
jgi:rRNA-processing protein FCF1